MRSLSVFTGSLLLLLVGGCSLAAVPETPATCPKPEDVPCAGGIESSGQPASGPVASGPALPTCGDGICLAPETCGACGSDCGACERPIELFFTRTSMDAAEARKDARLGVLEASLLADLLSAQESVELALYSLTRPSIISALSHLMERGVTVSLVTECENRQGAEAEVMDALERAGVVVRDDESSYAGAVPGCPRRSEGRMHHKFAVIDSRVVWMGSTNLTWTGLSYNENAMVRLDSPELARLFQAEHRFLSDPSRSGSRPKSARIWVGGVLVEVAFSSAQEGGSALRNLLLDGVRSARDSIEFAAFYLTDEELVTALSEASVPVLGALDATGAAHQSSRHGKLCSLGFPVTVDNRPGKLHHKLMVFDHDGEAPSVAVGSANFSESGFESNDEAVVRIFDRALAAQASLELALYRESPEHREAICSPRSGETPDQHSPLCGDLPCVCQDGLDNDHDGRSDGADDDCSDRS